MFGNENVITIGEIRDLRIFCFKFEVKKNKNLNSNVKESKILTQ